MNNNIEKRIRFIVIILDLKLTDLRPTPVLFYFPLFLILLRSRDLFKIENKSYMMSSERILLLAVRLQHSPISKIK